jgi:hypothetical protein
VRRYFAMLHVGAAIVMIGMAAPAIASPPAGERILDDSGGRIGAYLTKYEALRKSGQRVAIDGTCASACTLLVGVIPHKPRAVLATRRLGSQPDGRSEQRRRD